MSIMNQGNFIHDLSTEFYTAMFDFCFENRITAWDSQSITMGYGYF